MDLTNPMRSVIRTSEGEVLAVLARTEQPLSGRGVANLCDGRVSQKGANLALRNLVDSGIVSVESHPPTNLYRLNRRHLAAGPIEALATLRGQLADRMRDHLRSWAVQADGAWLFGSAARGDGDEGSDIDVLIVRPDAVDDGDRAWLGQVERFTDDVTAWTGNRCEIVEYVQSEFSEFVASGLALAENLRVDGVALIERSWPRPTARTSRVRR